MSELLCILHRNSQLPGLSKEAEMSIANLSTNYNMMMQILRKHGVNSLKTTQQLFIILSILGFNTETDLHNFFKKHYFKID